MNGLDIIDSMMIVNKQGYSFRHYQFHFVQIALIAVPINLVGLEIQANT